MDDKAALRGKLRARRRALPREDRLRAAQAVCQLALTRPEIAGARRVMAYRAARGELDLDPLAAALAERGAVLYYPKPEETLWEVARRYRIAEEELRQRNPEGKSPVLVYRRLTSF